MVPLTVRAWSAYKDIDTPISSHCMHACTHACPHMHACIYTHTCMHTCTHTHAHTHTCMHTCMRAHTHTRSNPMNTCLNVSMQKKRGGFWLFSFDLKEESEDECLTERGREFQILGPLYWKDHFPQKSGSLPNIPPENLCMCTTEARIRPRPIAF